MEIKEAQIQCTVQYLPYFETAHTTYKWVGERTWPVRFSPYMERYIPEMPWPLVKVPFSEDFQFGMVSYVRGDIPGLAFAYGFRNWIKIHGWWLKSRIIATFAVWGIGWIEMGAVPRWSDILRKNPNSKAKP